MIITITDVHQEFTKTGAEYQKVSGVDGDGKQTTKMVFDNLKDKWSLLGENKTLEFKMVKKGQFWNVADILQIETPPPQTSQEVLPEHQEVIEKARQEAKPPITGQEEGMWWKEAGEFIRLPDKQALEICKPDLLSAMRTAYFTRMFSVLGIKVEKKPKAPEKPEDDISYDIPF